MIDLPILHGRTRIDEADAPLVRPHKWRVCAQGYAVATIWHTGLKSPRQLRMHRLLLGALPGQIIDHINGDRLDNRRANLRFVTHHQNALNHKARSTSVANGIDRDRSWWRARIAFRGKSILLGRFTDLQDAIRARARAEALFFGEYSRRSCNPVPNSDHTNPSASPR